MCGEQKKVLVLALIGLVVGVGYAQARPSAAAARPEMTMLSGVLQPVELAGYKLGAYMSDYDVGGGPSKARQLDVPYLGFSEVVLEEADYRVVAICLQLEVKGVKFEDKPRFYTKKIFS